jgi:arabinofuranosyltransferase
VDADTNTPTPELPPCLPEADTRARPRTARVALAAVAAIVAWRLVPVFMPYADPDPLLQAWLGPYLRGASAMAPIAAALGYVLPYLLLGLLVYVQTGRAGVGNPPAPAVSDGLPTAEAGRRRLLSVQHVGLAVIVAGAVGLAYAQRFMDDDAYISLRYARHWAEGAGPVYNVGERVEGYTNFLWVAMLAGGIRLGADPVAWAQGLGLVCFAGMLAVTYRLGRLVLPTAAWAMAVVALVGTHFSVSAFATGGLETALQSVLLLLGLCIVVGAHLRAAWRTRDLVGLSLVLAAGVMTRMDFAVFGAVLGGAAAVSVRAIGSAGASPSHRRAETGSAGASPSLTGSKAGPTGGTPGARPTGQEMALLVGPAAVVLVVWLVGKAWYYGAVLPNTYYAKRPTAGAWRAGLDYVLDFCRTYRMGVALLVFALGCVLLVRQRHILLAAVVAMGAWCAYIVRMGGDFIEFRFFVPVVPLFVLCVTWTATRLAWARRMYLPVLLTVWMAYGSLHHARTFGWVQNRAEPVPHLRWQTRDARWAEAGQALQRWFGDSDVVIATTVAGVLPYYAELTTIDMHGLTDAAIAREGAVVSNRPGHKRFATYDTLVRRRVNLVIGHPKIEPAAGLDELPAGLLASCVQAASLPGGAATIVAIPIGERQVLLAWYLTPHPAIERAMATGGWRTWVVPFDPTTEKSKSRKVEKSK